MRASRDTWCIVAVLLWAACFAQSAFGAENQGIPSKSRIIKADYSESAVKARCQSMALQPVEGLWYYSEEKTSIMIERTDDTKDGYNAKYRIVYVDSDDYDLLPGTVMGYMEPSAENGKYVLWIFSEREVSTLFKPVKCVATLSADGESLTFVKPSVKLKFRMNVARFLPTLFRGLSVIAEKGSETMSLGFRKIYPTTSHDSENGVVRYL